MDWHPFSGPWGAFVVGAVFGAFVMTIAFLLSLIKEGKDEQKGIKVGDDQA